ncbi:hypothetical protein LTR74_009709 [Friedmanniomyces endolithicus]|nr:hypothetical protein LTR74_009709 [Friedmanniomyces endolithicus]
MKIRRQRDVSGGILDAEMLMLGGAKVKVNERRGSDRKCARGWIPTMYDQQASPRRKLACQTAGGELPSGLNAKAPEGMDLVVFRCAASRSPNRGRFEG